MSALTAPEVSARFWAKVDKTPTCWLWTAHRTSDGYGTFTIAKKPRMAHRLAYEAVVAPIPPGLHIDHLCRNPPCVNPSHLEPVTPRENVLRSPIAPSAINARKTHCIHGHEFTVENTSRGADGRRACRNCKRITAARLALKYPKPKRGNYRLRQTHCKRGHEYTAENTYYNIRGHRNCRICMRFVAERRASS